MNNIRFQAKMSIGKLQSVHHALSGWFLIEHDFKSEKGVVVVSNYLA